MKYSLLYVARMLYTDALWLQEITRLTSSTADVQSPAARSSARCPTALRSPSPTSVTSRAAEKLSSLTVSRKHRPLSMYDVSNDDALRSGFL